MRRTIVTALLALVGAASTLASAADSFVLHTEDYPPYQFMNKGKLDGENVKTVRELFKRAGIKIDMKMGKWDEGFAAAKNNINEGIFTTVRTPEREEQFQWVGPISATRWVLLGKKSKKFDVGKLEEAFKYKIGGVAGDAKTKFLEESGAKVDKIDNDAKNAERLKKDEIDLWVTGYISGMKHAKDIGLTDVEEIYAFREDYGYIALYKGTSQATALTLNRLLEKMKDEHLLDSVLKFKN